MLALFLSGEFLLHIPCLLYFSLPSFSYVSLAGYYFLSGDFLLHISCWLHFYLGSFSYTSHGCCFLVYFYFYLGSFCYASHDCFIFLWGVSLMYPLLATFFFFFLIWGVSLTHPVLASFLSGEFLLHIPCCCCFCVCVCGGGGAGGGFLLRIPYPMLTLFFFGRFSSTSQAGLKKKTKKLGSLSSTSLTCFFLIGEFLLHIPCWFHFYLGCFSYTYRAGFFFPFFLSSLLGVSQKAFIIFSSDEFLLHIPCWLNFYLGSFSYTSHACLIFLWGVSLAHPFFSFSFFLLFLKFKSGKFLFHIPYLLLFIWGVSLTHPVLASF